MHGSPYGNPPDQIQGLRSAPRRTPLADRDPEQRLTLLPNDLYPRDKWQPTRFVTKHDLIMVQITNDKRYANLYGIGDHRYHRAEHFANRPLNPGPPTDVKRYIEDCKNNGMTEVERYAVLDDNFSCLKDNCRCGVPGVNKRPHATAK